VKKLISLLLCVVLALCLCACGGGSATSVDPALGVYEGYSYEVLGFTYAMDEIYAGETFVELKSGGRGSLTLDDDSIDITWSVSGIDLEILIEGEPSYGTLEDGVLSLDFMNSGMYMVFAKPDADLPPIESAGLDDWDMDDDWSDDWDDDWSFETGFEPYDGSLQPIDESSLGVYLPDGFGFDSGWVAWSDGDVNIWLADASLYETVEDMFFWLDGKEYYEYECGDYYVYMVEEPDSFYGVATQYYVDFCGELEGYEGCRIMVTSFSSDMTATQSDEIYDMLAGISVIE